MAALAPTRAYVSIAAGLAVQMGSWSADLTGAPYWVCAFGAGAGLVYGCTLAAEAKGYARWLGFAGLFSFVGAVFLLLLPRPEGRTGLVRLRRRDDA